MMGMTNCMKNKSLLHHRPNNNLPWPTYTHCASWYNWSVYMYRLYRYNNPCTYMSQGYRPLYFVLHNRSANLGLIANQSWSRFYSTMKYRPYHLRNTDNWTDMPYRSHWTGSNSRYTTYMSWLLNRYSPQNGRGQAPATKQV